MTVRHTFPGMPPSTETEYIQPDRKRIEYRTTVGFSGWRRGQLVYVHGPRLALITRCDLGRGFMLNLDDREYESSELPTYSRPTAPTIAMPAVTLGPPTLLIQTTTVDTGERKEIFGYGGRRVVTTRRHVALGAREEVSDETRTDGWYIDLDTRLTCEPPRYRGHMHAVGHVIVAGDNPADVRTVPPTVFEDIGTPETGYPIEMHMSSRSLLRLPDGTAQEHDSSWSMQVTNLSLEPIDPSLFDIPSGFRQVERINQEPRMPFSVRLFTTWERLTRVRGRRHRAS